MSGSGIQGSARACSQSSREAPALGAAREESPAPLRMAGTGLDFFVTTKDLLERYAELGEGGLLDECRAPAALANVFDKSEAEAASILAGSVVLHRRGGAAFIMEPDETKLFCDMAAGRGCRYAHPQLNLGAAVVTLRGCHGYLRGAGSTDTTFTMAGSSIPVNVEFEMSSTGAQI